MLLISSCNNNATLLLRAVKSLKNFPSASAIEYGNNRVFIFGDDVAYALILDTLFNQLDTIRFLPDTAYRIGKEIKPDIESAALTKSGDTTVLIAFGSMSTKNRFRSFCFPLSQPHSVSPFQNAPIIKRLQYIKELNLEGAAFIKEILVLANRAHLGNPDNQLFIINMKHYDSAYSTISIQLPHDKNVIGISGLYYIVEKNRLLFTASEEATSSTTSDGDIGNSYLGWIDDFSKKMHQNTLKPTVMISLNTIDPRFHKQKIESVCAIKVTNKAISLMLTADNDNGESTLFKMQLFD
jgi:hypothetical protein